MEYLIAPTFALSTMLSGRRFDPQNFFGPLTPAVKAIVIVTTAVYVLSLIVPPFNDFLWQYCILNPKQVLGQGYVWQLASYMLVHGGPAGPWHVVLNMLFLWMFGSPVEATWGSKRFVQYYLLCGIGAGVFVLIHGVPTLGASGAVFGVMVAFAMVFPNSVIYFMGLFPMKATHLVILILAVEAASFLSSSGGGISYVAHLSGALVGFLYLKFSWRMAVWWKHTFGGKQGPRGPRLETRRPPTRSGGRGGSGEPAPAGPMRISVPSDSPRPRVSPEEAAIQKRADEILDKISREGMGSLSREEREILQKHSQILKQKDVVNLDDYRS